MALLSLCAADVVAQPSLSIDSRTQDLVPSPTPAADRLASFDKATKAHKVSIYKSLPFQSVGPTIMSGRVVDIEVSPSDPTKFYVAYATGGVWLTESNGTDFRPLLDGLPTAGIGDVAVRWGDDDVVYVGTGESNASRSVVAGAGLYRTRNGGEHWDYLGLAETHNIGRVVLSPRDTNVIYVAAVGHLFSKNPERGVYRSTDGGETWNPALQIDDSTGVVDLVMDPGDPDILYAAAWHRQRRPWDFIEGGFSSGVYKTIDGGETWTLISTKKSGLPTGRIVGRIGLSIAVSDPSTLYAVVDNQTRLDKDEELPALSFEALETMSSEKFLEYVFEEDLTEFLDHYDFPDEYDAESVRDLIRRGEIVPADLPAWVGETNRLVYDTDVVGCEVYRSNDGGAHWHRTNETRLKNVCESYGYYFGRVAVDPRDVDTIYLAGIPLLKSEDGGATFENVGRENVHLDHHALWIDPERPGHLISGNDGGLNLSYDGGETWLKLNTPPVGQFVTAAFDFAEPYNVYGGLQDNGVWFGPSTYEASVEWHGEGQYPYRRLLGGDGMMVQVSPQDDDVVFAGKQFGEYYRLSKRLDETISIKPYHHPGEERLRFNWLTPIHLSIHNDRILYLGSQKVHRSMDRGDTWHDLSGDLTGGGRKGDVPFGTLTVLVESPRQFGVLYTGSDDGFVHGTRDGGVTWSLLSDDLPRGFWVSSIEPSRHVDGRVFLALNGARQDDFRPMLYVSVDFGQAWNPIGGNLPLESINVVREDPHNPDLLFVGTDRGLYISRNGGEAFSPAGGLPVVPVNDVQVHPRDRELVVATHGRSIYRADVRAVEDLDQEIIDSPLHVFAPDTVWADEDWGDRDPDWSEAEEPDVRLTFWSDSEGDAEFIITSENGIVLRRFKRSVDRGLNYLSDDLSVCEEWLEDYFRARTKEGRPADRAILKARDNGKRYLPPDTYDLQIRMRDRSAHAPLIVSE